MYNVKARYRQSKPYTNTGDILIACNPFVWIDGLYSHDTQHAYAQAWIWSSNHGNNTKKNDKNQGTTVTTHTSTTTDPHNNNDDDDNDDEPTNRRMEPHIYEVSARAYHGLATQRQDQAILVSGESGAGKTQSVKICMQHIASLVAPPPTVPHTTTTTTAHTRKWWTSPKKQEQPGHARNNGESSSLIHNKNTTDDDDATRRVHQQRILDSNPLLEAFGNAQTARNDNSSRFGKYTQLQFDVGPPVQSVHVGHRIPSCTLVGSLCHVYMLEKSRIVQQSQSQSSSSDSRGRRSRAGTKHQGTTTTRVEPERNFHIFYQLLAPAQTSATAPFTPTTTTTARTSAPPPPSLTTMPKDNQTDTTTTTRHRRPTERELNAVKREVWPRLLELTPDSFCYLGGSAAAWSPSDTIEGLTDRQHFANTVHALTVMGITGPQRTTLFRALCIVLQLGNLVFAEQDETPSTTQDQNACRITNQQDLHELTRFMGLDTTDHDKTSNALESALLFRTMKARNEEFIVPLTATQARDACNALAKEIYAQTFSWLVDKINQATQALPLGDDGKKNANASDRGVIGLLDITGFESFDTNRFEQLCFNYANEKLQRRFAQDVFVSIQQEYKAEGIELDQIAWPDNSTVLDLIEGKMGLLSVLNEECLRPGGSDAAFVTKIVNLHAKGNSTKNGLIKDKRFGPTEFAIDHYAHQVLYTSEGFIAKNKDLLPTALQDCARASSNEIVKLVAPPKDIDVTTTTPPDDPEQARPEMHPAAAAPVATKRKPLLASEQSRQSNLVQQTVWTKFKIQLSDLMDTLSRTRTRYIQTEFLERTAVNATQIDLGTTEMCGSGGCCHHVTIHLSQSTPPPGCLGSVRGTGRRTESPATGQSETGWYH